MATCTTPTAHGTTPTATQPPPQQHLYLNEKWKLSKKEGSRSLSTSSSSCLMKRASSISSKSSKPRTFPRCSFTRKCASLVKEQRARFYIMRRCVTMLICWRDYSES